MVALTSNSDPTTSSYIPNDFEPLEKSNITTTPETHSLTLTFRRPDLPHIYIGNCVSLYNSGLYEESSAVDLSNRIGLTSAFERRTFLGNILSKDAVFKSSKKQQSSKVAIVSKYVHLTPHKHSDMLHHIHRQREAPHFPIRYFVAISHSGHSINPHNKHIWAKWEGEEEKATDVIINYDLPLSICFGPSRLERVEELEIFPLRYCRHEMNKPKNCTSKTENFKRILQKRESSTGVTTEKHLSSAHEDPYHQLQFSTPLPTVPFEEVVIQKPTEELQNADEPMHQSKTRRILAFALFHIHTKNGKGGEQKVTAPAEIEKFEEKLHDETSCPQKKYTAKIVLKPGQSISTGPQTKLTDGKKDDEKKTTKKAQKKKKGKKAAEGGASTSVNSSSSSSSSSSDAEEEEVHVLVDHQQPAEQITKQQSKLGTTSPKYKLVIEPPPAHTTVETWHEETIGPEQVSTEIDEQGNIIKRTVRSEQVKHTIQTQSYQAVPINGHDDVNQQQFGTEQPLNSHAYENGHKGAAENDASSGDLVSSKVVTTGNRSVETLTYKTEKDGMVETRVEHRITIHSNEDIDHDAELSRAILEATSMNPELKVEKVEVERG